MPFAARPARTCADGAPRKAPRRRPAAMALTFLLAGLVSLAAFPLAVRNLVVYDLWYVLYGLIVLAAFAWGVRRYRPGIRRGWVVLAVGVAASVAGDSVYLVSAAFSWSLPYPSAADGFYLASYPLLAVGLLLMLRARTPGRDRTSLIDAAIVTSGAAVVAWVFLIEPLASSDETLVQKLVSVAYPLMDVLLLSVAARMLVIGGTRARTYVLILGAIAAQLVGDSLYPP